MTLTTPACGAAEMPENRKLGPIFNSDINGLLTLLPDRAPAADEYRQAVRDMLGYGMTMLAQNVGMPDPVVYRSKVATTWDKYHNEVVSAIWGSEAGARDRQAARMKGLLDANTDVLRITIEECRKRGVLVVASYRMNAEDFYGGELDLYDFGRAHKDLRIPGANCLDPAHPEVFDHRMAIFREVAENYDIDGLEFDFKRWHRMISDPARNHTVLTRMVRETRDMLDGVAQRKGRQRLLLGVRVAAALDTSPSKEAFPGMVHPQSNPSCTGQGTDVKTWIEEGLVDYVCPSMFWPRLPGLPRTREFVELARGTSVGVYPTVFPLPAWAEDAENPIPDSIEARRRHRDEILGAALTCFRDGADGISTFNWNRDNPDSPLNRDRKYVEDYGRPCAGYSHVNIQVHRRLAAPQALEELLKTEPPTAGLRTASGGATADR